MQDVYCIPSHLMKSLVCNDLRTVWIPFDSQIDSWLNHNRDKLIIQDLTPIFCSLTRVLALLETYSHITRQTIFDLFIVATMLGNGVNRIYTFSESDFALFTEIQVSNNSKRHIRFVLTPQFLL